MEWSQVWAIIGANIGLAVLSVGSTLTLFLWARAEGNADRRQLQSEFNALLRAVSKDRGQPKKGGRR